VIRILHRCILFTCGSWCPRIACLTRGLHGFGNVDVSASCSMALLKLVYTVHVRASWEWGYCVHVQGFPERWVCGLCLRGPFKGGFCGFWSGLHRRCHEESFSRAGSDKDSMAFPVSLRSALILPTEAGCQGDIYNQTDLAPSHLNV
jgi:hypothetical protein